ncbi:hypothetical protein BDR07DRAFT_1613517 [Suillus spraguei]|nr:hypothetical protein BDR07DRAFT_1613517 [Suillus spraguei]
MHPALLNLDVIYTISSYTEHKSLPALASTCRGFEHLALNVLWRDLPSVDPLVKCLPSDLFSLDQGHEVTVVLQKPVDSNMWNTFCNYASRVHSITQSVTSQNIDRLGLLMMSCPSAPMSSSLFPNLVHLTWNADGTRSAAEFLRMALVPSLVVFSLQVCSPSPSFLAVLSSLGASCPHLRVLNTVYRQSEELSRKVSPFITQSISQLQHIQTLAIWDIGNQGIKHVMQLRALRFLSLDFTTSSAWDAKLYFPLPGFHDLDNLSLSIDAFGPASNFLSSLQVVRSKEIKVNMLTLNASAGALSAALSQFFTVLQERCDNDKLESLSIVYSRGVAVKSGVFTSLHAFRNLTRLLINGSFAISMSDEGLCQLVRAWPKLQVLNIGYYATDKMMVPTFHGLIHMLRLCPGLTSLALVIDTTKLDGIDLKHPGGGISNQNLQSLVLGNSPIESPANVALILSGLFPRLHWLNLEHCDPLQNLLSGGKLKKKWVLVNVFLGCFSVVRERCIEA